MINYREEWIMAITDRDMRDKIETILSQTPGGLDDFDLEAIVDECHKANGTWDLDDISPSRFWGIVRQHDRTQQVG